MGDSYRLGHFQIAFSLFLKASLGMYPFICTSCFFFVENLWANYTQQELRDNYINIYPYSKFSISALASYSVVYLVINIRVTELDAVIISKRSIVKGTPE